jgi:hypothetical protein
VLTREGLLATLGDESGPDGIYYDPTDKGCIGIKATAIKAGALQIGGTAGLAYSEGVRFYASVSNRTVRIGGWEVDENGLHLNNTHSTLSFNGLEIKNISESSTDIISTGKLTLTAGDEGGAIIMDNTGAGTTIVTLEPAVWESYQSATNTVYEHIRLKVTDVVGDLNADKTITVYWYRHTPNATWDWEKRDSGSVTFTIKAHAAVGDVYSQTFNPSRIIGLGSFPDYFGIALTTSTAQEQAETNLYKFPESNADTSPMVFPTFRLIQFGTTK